MKDHSRRRLPQTDAGPFFRPPTSLCLQAVCRSILITIQIVIDLPSPGPVATRSHFATLAPIETANTAGPAGPKCSALGGFWRTRVTCSLHDGWINPGCTFIATCRTCSWGGGGRLSHCLDECSVPLMYFAPPPTPERGSRS